ncbi:unnamed protein product [Timema podura]|uniref:JmjC domain-containing protein n=1 Tax=Timema podura TaxID=61482 RepID=A0ABN7NJY6_TIMPD|nr:unnamed protein product [Timema podura]
MSELHEYCVSITVDHTFCLPRQRTRKSIGFSWGVQDMGRTCMSNCDERIARVLRQHYGRPYFLPTTAENKKVDWIFMGSPGYGAHMHLDGNQGATRHPPFSILTQKAQLP